MLTAASNKTSGAIPSVSGPLTMAHPNQQNRPPQLRRAVYVHVSDLTNSYNIDHARLEEELARVKQQEKATAVESHDDSERLGVPAELETGYSQRRLSPPKGGYNLCVLVGNVNVVVDKNRVDGSRVRLAEVEVGDETGTVSLRARDDQIDILKEVSSRQGAVVLRNCTLELYQGKHIRLAVTKWGKLSIYPDMVASTPPPPSKMNRDRNFSLIDLSAVASELATFQPTDVQHPHTIDSQQQLQQQQQQHIHRPQQSFHNKPSMIRRNWRTGRGGGKPATSNIPGHYGESNFGYQSGVQGYGIGHTKGPPYPYTGHRQQEGLARNQQQQQHPQMMMQHHSQYDMRHRQIQQQLYPAVHDPHQRANIHSPILLSGMSNIPPYDATNYRPPGTSDVGAAAFMEGGHHQSSAIMSKNRRSSPHPSPPLPLMNPKAATYDPTHH